MNNLCATCGHEEKEHEEWNGFTSRWNKSKCHHKSFDKLKGYEADDCSCKKFKPVQSPETKALRDYPIRKPLKDYPVRKPLKDNTFFKDWAETKPRVYIERAEPLTREGIKAICMSDEDYKKYRKDKTPDALRGCGKDFDYYKKFKWTCGIDGILCLSCQKKQENYNGR